MVKALIISVILCTNSLYAQDDLLEDVRQNIASVFSDEEVCDRLNKAFEKADLKGNVLLEGYRGGLLIGLAKHRTNPIKRLGYLSDGKELLENSIARSNMEQSVELRFLRLTIQTNLPSFLGYNDDKDADKAFVLENLSLVDSEQFKTQVKKFISTAEEEGKL